MRIDPEVSSLKNPKSNLRNVLSWQKTAMEWYEDPTDSIEAKLEKLIPGIAKGFDSLLNLLPDKNNHYNTEFPVVAGVFRMGESGIIEPVIVAENEVNKNTDSTAHAEMLAIQGACSTLEDKHLSECIVLSTHEPCMMCTGAMINADIAGIVYSLSHKDVENTYAFVNGIEKEFRISKGSFSSDQQLSGHTIPAIGGYRRSTVLQMTVRTLREREQ